jgi:hypothetical protein
MEIKAGTKIQTLYGTMIVTGEAAKFYTGYTEYKGKKIETHILKYTLVNPHYAKNIKIIN